MNARIPLLLVPALLTLGASAACATHEARATGRTAPPPGTEAASGDQAEAEPGTPPDRTVPAVPARAKSGRKDPLSPTARAVIATKMDRHAQDMTDLMWAVVFLEHDAAAEIADEIASEPRMARPTGDQDGDLANARIPEDFFRLQDELRTQANALAAGARKGDDAAIAEAYGRLSQTCVSCHAKYLD